LYNKLTIGILYKDNKIVNHRSLIKVLLNPVFRYFGFQIGSVCRNNMVVGIKLQRCPRSRRIHYDFNSYNEYDFILKKRMII